MQFCSHLLCCFNLSDNLELYDLENVEIPDYSHSSFPPLSMLKQKMAMALCTPFLHCPLIPLGTTITCQTFRGVDPSPSIGHVDLQVLPSHPRQHWGWTPPSTQGDTQQHSHVPGLPSSPGQGPPCSWWALQHFTRLHFSMPCSLSYIILYTFLLLLGLWPALGQRRPRAKKME